jgi:hypothetical protein
MVVISTVWMGQLRKDFGAMLLAVARYGISNGVVMKCGLRASDMPDMCAAALIMINPAPPFARAAVCGHASVGGCL